MNGKTGCTLFFILSALCGLCAYTNAYAQIPLENVMKETEGKKASPNAGKISRIASISLTEAQDEAGTLSETTLGKEKEILHPWKDKVKFELNLDKIRAFIIAGMAVEKNNRNWDALLAGADTPEKAKEFFQQETEEAAQIISEIPNISVDEYKILYQLSLKDNDFAILIKALKQHIYPDDDFSEE